MINKEEKARKKKKIIVEALKRCLERDVYSRITVQDIADEAGFSKGGLLYYFSTKEELYIELMNDLFTEIEQDHVNILEGVLHSNEKAGISALYGIEKFFLNKKTLRIFLNLILYGFEEEKIMEHIRTFIRKHLNLYQGIVTEARANIPQRRKTDFETQVIARIAQIIVLSAAIFESIDPTEMDSMNLVRFINALFKG
jgi:AcrR family transcriptional regulator